MSGERYYTTKIWPQPSSTGSSNEDASFISTDPRGEPVTSTWKKSCREVETVPEFPELTCQNFRNPQFYYVLLVYLYLRVKILERIVGKSLTLKVLNIWRRGRDS